MILLFRFCSPETPHRQIPFAAVGEDRNDPLALAELRRNLERGPARSAGRDAHEQALRHGEPLCGRLRVVCRHLDYFMEDRPVQDLRYEARADALDGMGAGLTAREYRRAAGSTA